MVGKMDTSGRRLRTIFVPIFGALCLLLGGRADAGGHFKCRSGTLYGPSRDCSEVYKAGHAFDGVYKVKPTNWTGEPFDVYCNMTSGGGWTVFQRRVNGSVDFYRNWTSYKEGFGELSHEFWLGNDKLYYLTNQGNYSIRIDMVHKYGDPYYAEYDFFRINDESDHYRLSGLGNYNGTVDAVASVPQGYAFIYHLNAAFSTFDKDNDAYGGGNCAVLLHGAWWYKVCARSNLNGDYDVATGIWWAELPGNWHNIKYTEMKIIRLT